MRALDFLVIFALPTTLWAGDIPLTSAVSAVTLYPQGASVQRSVPFSAPSGQHDLILLDLPQNTDLQSVRVTVTGARMGGVTTRRDFVPPRGDRMSGAVTEAEAEVARREDALSDARADIARLKLVSDAADAQVAFLTGLGQGDGMAAQDVATLRDMVQMIGAQTLEARQSAHDARRHAEKAERGLKDLEVALEEARRALAALVPEDAERALLAVSITADDATEGALSVTYQVYDAGWAPVYDMTLTRDTGALAIARGAYVRQNTGENWKDVALTLSTVRPGERTTPSVIDPMLRRIGDPVQLMRKATEGALESAANSLRMDAAPPVFMADAEFDGLAVTYRYAPPASVASGADALRIALGDLDTQARIEARAVPLYDETAYLMANLTNDMDELILPGQTNLYLDDTYVGQIAGELIAAGAKAELPFGPIEGLRLTRTVPDREEGGSGLIRKSNDLTETAKIAVENLTAEPWAIRLLDRVPYSEQEELKINWQADPRPAQTDVDGQRGILAWEFDLAANATQTITLEHEMKWPEDKVLD